MLTRIIFAFLLFLNPKAFASVTVVVNGTNHTIPQTNEKGWGTNVTAWIQAISSYTLQNSGGTFTLTAEVNTGATYGFKVPYIKTATATPSTAGVLRLAVTDSIGWRNNANGANLLLAVDGSNNLTFSSVIIPTATSASVQDSTFTIYDNVDSTKKIAFQVSGVTTGTTRTLTAPDADTTIVGTDTTQTLTNKTLTAPVISTISNTGTLTLPTTTTTIVGRNTTDTLTNKTLSGNTAVNLISGSGTLTLNTTGTMTVPNATDTLVGKTTTDTFTNKTFDVDGSGNSLSNVANASIKAAAAIAVNKLAALTASRAVVSDGSGFVSAATTTSTEIGYVNGVTSAIQTQLNAKAPTAGPTFSGTITTPLTASRALTTGSSSELAVSATTATQLGYLSTTTSDVQSQITAITSAASEPDEIHNCSFAASVASHALTIALKDSAGSDPAGGSACKISFRNATAATGTYSEVSTTAAVSVVISNGSALGCNASASCTLYVYAINNAGTVELAVAGGSIFDEGTVQTSTAEGGAGGADTLGTLYSTTARASKAIRLLGRLTVTPAAAFAWDNAPTELSNSPFALPTITNWTSYTPTCSWVSNTTCTGFWRRVGSDIEVKVKAATSGAPTSANLTFNLPTGLTFDTTRMVDAIASFTDMGGTGSANDSSTSAYKLFTAYSSTTAVVARYQSNASGLTAFVTQAAPFTFGSGDSVELTFKGPITGW